MIEHRLFIRHPLIVVGERFVICKELAHLVIDTDPKHFTTNPVSLVQGLISQLPDVDPEKDLDSEKLALFAAIEMLMPWSLRPKMNEMMKQNKSDYEIAVELRAPENLVNIVLKSEFYIKISKKVSEALSSAE